MSGPVGTGLAPLGTSAYGFGTPAVAPEQGGAVHRASSGLQKETLSISLAETTKGQFVFDEFGRRVGTGSVDHMVTLALRTVRGSSVDPALGHRLAEIRKVTDSFPQEARTRIEEALADIVARRILQIDNLSVVPRDGKPSQILVQATDLTTREPVDFVI